MPASESPPSSEGNPPNKPDTAICGKKFRTMLSCVEKTGAVNACTDKINEFLNCERHVFRTAIQKPPRQLSAAPSQQQVAPSQPPRPAEDTTEQSSESLTRPYSAIRRVVEKQLKACQGVVELMRRPDYSTKVMDFGRRMMADMRVTCQVVQKKSAQLWERFLKLATNGDDDGSQDG